LLRQQAIRNGTAEVRHQGGPAVYDVEMPKHLYNANRISLHRAANLDL
jgi:hypothetical protein